MKLILKISMEKNLADGSIDVLAPFPSDANPKAGTKEAARAAIGAAEVGSGNTDYFSALELAQQRAVSRGEGESGGSERLSLHLGSDVQASGMPKRTGYSRVITSSMARPSSSIRRTAT